MSTRFHFLLCFAMLTSATLSGCYDPAGPIPEQKKPGVEPQWSDADVDQVVSVTYEAVAPLQPDVFSTTLDSEVPDACREIRFLRFKARDSSPDASEADAAVLLVPGVLEGANGFDYIGRQLVYLAKIQRNKNVEVWALDRRSNCLEDLTGFNAAEMASTAGEAEDLMLGYYYNGVSIGGKTFDGFLQGKQVSFLMDFGMEQTTRDMFAVLRHMVPDASVSRQKVYVGGHSLGGVHTSVFLSWDLDGDLSTVDDQGANLVAGALGFDTSIGSVLEGLPGMSSAAPMVDVAAIEQRAMNDVSDGGVPEPAADSDAAYRRILQWMEQGILPKTVDIPLVFSAEAISIPEAAGILASKGPEEESTIVRRMPKSPEVNNLFRFFHTRNGPNYSFGPHIESFRYTNEALVGQMFDEHFSILSFLQTSLGHMHGGAVVPKSPFFHLARSLPILGDLVNAISGPNQQFIAADAGPDRQHLGEGPLYSWTSMDEIGTSDDPLYTDVTGRQVYTEVREEMVRMEDFSRALFVGPTNLTEWYFPLRILMDTTAIGKSFAPQYGLNTLKLEAYREVPTLLVLAASGLSEAMQDDDGQGRALAVMWLDGQSHLDPLFATVNTPDLYQNPIPNRLLDFMLQGKLE